MGESERGGIQTARAGSSPNVVAAARPPSTPPDRDLPGALHEVSNALTVVLAWIESARELSGDASEAARALDVAASRARQARHIVRRAIGARVPEEPPVPVAGVLNDAVTGLDPEARRAGLTLSLDLGARVEDLVVERASAVQQILTNLILNAIAVSPDGGVVRVDAQVGGAGAVVIGVSDDGPGVAADRRATLMEAGVSTRSGGAGIGLRHASALARDAGGALSLAETASGARFELRWPYHRPDRQAGAISTPGRAGALAGARILVIEDDDAVIELLETALTARGATVVAVQRARELGPALAGAPFDAALFDMSPIQDDVAGALQAVRSQSPAARLVVISGSAVSLPELPAGCDPTWVRKPFEVGEIVRAVIGAGPVGSLSGKA